MHTFIVFFKKIKFWRHKNDLFSKNNIQGILIHKDIFYVTFLVFYQFFAAILPAHFFKIKVYYP